MNAFPINGLRPDGECNPEGIQLMPGSLTGGIGNACNGSTLEVLDNQLVGVRDHRVICDSNKLKGASFVARSWVQKPGNEPGYRTLTIQIEDVVSYTASNGEVRTAYQMKSDGVSLCSTAGASAARDALGIRIIDGLTDPPTGHDVVIPVVSELYNILGQPIPPTRSQWTNPRAEWISLACVDDALAKRSMYGLFTDNVKNSRAALHMLMANYCNDLPVTKRGVVIGWELFDDETGGSQVETKPASDAPILEAKWDDRGAVCLSEPRLLYEQLKIPDELPPPLKKICPDCPTPEAWAAKVRGCEAVRWAEQVLTKESSGPFLPYVAHTPLTTCEECKTAACKGRLFHSYVKKP